MRQYIMLVDLDRCIGCKGGCQIACKAEYDLALGQARSTLYAMGPTGVYPDLELYFMPVMCQQCGNPACVNVCPVGACYKNAADGVIEVDAARCIGCQGCKRACPYDALMLNKEIRVMDKCTLCAGRRQAGAKPACVQNCSGRALLLGDINDPESEVSKAVRAAGPEHVFALQDFGNEPAGRFILRGANWIDVLPQDYEQQLKEGYRWA